MSVRAPRGSGSGSRGSAVRPSAAAPAGPDERRPRGDAAVLAASTPLLLVTEAAAGGELAAALAAIGWSAEVVVGPCRTAAALASRAGGAVLGVLAATPDDLAALPALATHAASEHIVALVPEPARCHPDAVVAGDVGLAIVSSPGALAAALALRAHDVERPWLASAGSLGPSDRARLAGLDGGGPEGRFIRQGPAIALARRGKPMSPALALGDAGAVREAVLALQDAALAGGPPPGFAAERPDASMEVLFGPARALSDPASKAALAPYGLPFPQEVTCASPSAAAAAASRLGFPVRLSLASPDLRFTEHPDLAIDGIRHASGARDAYRELMLRAELLSADARILGATVSRSSIVTARLSIRAVMHRAGFAVARLAFADEHGHASRDETWLRIPASTAMVRRATGRLRGGALIEDTEVGLADIVARLAAFTLDRAAEVALTELEPVVRLADGRAEVWGARVVVGDAFARALD